MPNYQYDCTNNTEPQCGTNGNNNMFNDVCTHERTQKAGKYTFYSFQDVLRTHNLTKKHIILKTDIEGGEFPTLRYLPLEDLDYIDQIVG